MSGRCIPLHLFQRGNTFSGFSKHYRTYPEPGRLKQAYVGLLNGQGILALGPLPVATHSKKGRVVAAQTIPFPVTSGNAAAANQTLLTPPPPPPASAADRNRAPRRYRGLHVVVPQFKVSRHLNRLAQTQAIVAQVEREIAEKARRERLGANLALVSTDDKPERFLAGRAAYHVITSLLQAGL